MPFLGFLIPWLGLLAVCAACAVLPAVRSGNALGAAELGALPLAVLSVWLLALCCAGCLGALGAALWVLAALGAAAAAGLAALLLGRRGAAGRGALVQALCCPGWLVAFGGSLALALLMAAKQPQFNAWDEFSFWGTAAKVLWQNDTLYTLVEHTNLAARSYSPALPVLGYTFTAFSRSFAPGMVYAGYGVLTFAVLGCVTGLAGANRRAAALGGAVAVLLPLAVEAAAPHQKLLAYATAYADQMLGVVCAGVLALWLALEKRSLGLRLAAAIPAVALLGMVKDVGLPLGLVAALAAGVDAALDARRLGRRSAPRRPWDFALLRGAAVFCLLAAAALAAYFGWAQHLAAALSQDRSDTGGSAGLSTVGMLTAGVRELLGVGRTEKFTHVLRSMVLAVFTRRVTVFGPGVLTVGAAALVLGCARWAARRRGRHAEGSAVTVLHRRPAQRVAGFAAVSLLGYAGYSFFQLLCYVYVFSDAEGRALASYPRYMGTWYLYWLLAALAFLQLQLQQQALPGPVRRALSAGQGAAAQQPAPRYILRGTLLLAALTAALGLVCALRISPARTALGMADADWAIQTDIQRRADQALAAAGGNAGHLRQTADLSDEKVLLISQWDDGGRWYRYDYALEPLALHRMPGDNTLLPFEPQAGADTRYHLYVPPAKLAAFLREHGITLLLLDVDDYDFRLSFAHLFSDGMAGYDTGSCCVYRVQYTHDAEEGVRFVPCIGADGEVLYE